MDSVEYWRLHLMQSRSSDGNSNLIAQSMMPTESTTSYCEAFPQLIERSTVNVMQNISTRISLTFEFVRSSIELIAWMWNIPAVIVLSNESRIISFHDRDSVANVLSAYDEKFITKQWQYYVSLCNGCIVLNASQFLWRFNLTISLGVRVRPTTIT